MSEQHDVVGVDTPPPAGRSEGEVILDVRQVEVVYNRVQVAVKGVSLQVPDKGIVVVLGPNGAGKSTLLRAISGFMPAENGQVTDGDVVFEGQSLRGLPPEKIAKLGVCIMPQEDAIFAGLSVDDNLRVVPHPGNEASRQELLATIFDLFPRLAERRRQLAGFMSGGERKMLAMARALLLKPKVMLVDELSFGLAPMVVEQLIGVLGDINAQQGTSVVLVEQNVAAALIIGQYAYIIETGQVVFEGSPEDLRGNDTIREHYLGLSEESGEKSYAEVKQYRRQHRWGG